MSMLLYSALVTLLFLADRISKWYAVHTWIDEQVITSFLSFQLTFNRGISWGLLWSSHAILFAVMTIVIMTVTALVAFYACYRYKNGYSIYGELAIIAGSSSNIIDRCMYGGVVDFIMLHKGEWVWPLFNIADICIVSGICLMATQLSSIQKHA